MVSEFYDLHGNRQCLFPVCGVICILYFFITVNPNPLIYFRYTIYMIYNKLGFDCVVKEIVFLDLDGKLRI